MTQWVENPTGGRDRGPIALLRAWVEILLRPQRFFQAGIAPGDQAPALVFIAVVVLVEEASRFAVVELAQRGQLSLGPYDYPVIGDLEPLMALLALVAIVVFVAPAVLHLTAAAQTLLLAPLAPDRGGISETVQVIAYATAPCVFAGLPIPEVRIACGLWGTGLYVYGMGTIHNLSLPRALVVSAVPAAVLFGYGFRTFAAANALL
ncbi:YIP1 family protein [Halomicrobium sp. HM KBTZ05]|uniref:YIP1 family protein n=1 Tax=Halomicrobium sp. HM KBTZ05 TaxID=3242663 RepID=UPI00355661AF